MDRSEGNSFGDKTIQNEQVSFGTETGVPRIKVGQADK